MENAWMDPKWVEYFLKDSRRSNTYAIDTRFEVAGTFSSDGNTGTVAWRNTRVKYEGVVYNITDGSTTKEWIYWNRPFNYFQSSTSIPSISVAGGTQVVGQNSNGQFVPLWNVGGIEQILNLIKGIASLSSILCITDNATNVAITDELFNFTVSSNSVLQLEPTQAVVYRGLDIRQDVLKIQQTQVVGPRQSAILNLAGSATLSDVINKVNEVLAMLRTHGLIES